MCSIPSQITVDKFMRRKTDRKKEINRTDLDNEIKIVDFQNEEEREAALLNLITKIIVRVTLEEYYEARDHSKDDET
jgi:hypothetical protein